MPISMTNHRLVLQRSNPNTHEDGMKTEKFIKIKKKKIKQFVKT